MENIHKCHVRLRALLRGLHRGRRRTGPVRAAKDRFQVWSEEDIQRPTSGTSGSSDKVHIDVVEVRTRFSVENDGDEVVVKDFGHFWRIERLSVHDMTPFAWLVLVSVKILSGLVLTVTGVEADAQKDEALMFSGQLNGLGEPTLPCYRIVLVRT